MSRATFYSFLNQILTIVYSIIILKFASYKFSLEELEVWVLMIALAPYIGLLDLGVGQILIREISFEKIKSKPSIEKIAISICMFNLVVLGFFLLLTPAIIIFHSGYLALFFVANIVRIFSNYNFSLIYVMKSVESERLTKLATNVAYFIMTLLFINMDFGYYSIGLAILISSLLAVFVGFLLTPQDFSVQLDFSVIKRNLQNIKNWALTAIPSLFVFNSTIYVISINLDPNEVVQYVMLFQIYFGILQLSVIPRSMYLSSWAMMYKTGKLGELNENVKKVLNVILTLIIVGAIISTVFVDKYFSFINSEISVPQFNILVLFSILIMLEAFQTTTTAACNIVGYTDFIISTFAAAILSIIFTFVFSMNYGLVGVVLGLILSQLFTCGIFNVRRFFYLFKFPVADYLIRAICFFVLLVFCLWVIYVIQFE